MQREELVNLALGEGVNLSELCRRKGISRQLLYKWMHRAQEGSGYSSRSRRPLSSPDQTAADLEAAVVALRLEHPVWGGRKLRRLLELANWEKVPSASTITAILRRHNLLGKRAGLPREYKRFERSTPNELWQMDFKGHFAVREGRCHPFTVLDDHSRYSLGIFAHPNERKKGVMESLERVFRDYGLPESMLFDNGGPWGSPSRGVLGDVTIWLTLLGIRVFNGRPYHPQTQGKLERFHETLKAEALQNRTFANLDDCQRAFDAFRHTYNHHRPHDSLDLGFPATRYRLSTRSFPSRLPEPEYSPDCHVRKVQTGGLVSFQGHEVVLKESLRGYPVGFRQIGEDLWEIRFCARVLGQARLTKNPLNGEKTVNYVPEQL